MIPIMIGKITKKLNLYPVEVQVVVPVAVQASPLPKISATSDIK